MEYWMARSKAVNKSSNLQLVDVGAFLLALWFVYSVINNARDLIETNIKNAPASYALILALVLMSFSCYHQKKLNLSNVVTLTVLATAATIWLFGLSTSAGQYSSWLLRP